MMAAKYKVLVSDELSENGIEILKKSAAIDVDVGVQMANGGGLGADGRDWRKGGQR